MTRELTKIEWIRLQLETEIAKEAALETARIAIATKAEIGSRREAQAMNTASQATKKANKLELQLDQAKLYASVKKMEAIHSREFPWKPLKEHSIALNLPINKAHDSNYLNGVNTYHQSAWIAAYGVFTEPKAKAA